MRRVILIHGNGDSSGSDNWFPWLQSELSKLDVACETPDFPNPQAAKAEDWLPYLQDNLKADKETILVGHSSGAVAAMRYAEQHQIYGSVLVGTYYTDLGYEDEKASGYFDTPWNWELIRQNQNWVVVFASTDDPYVDIEEPRLIKDELRAEYYEFDNQGHFGEGNNKLEFPELLVALKKKLDLK